jgi:hypothetical protein
MPILLTTRQRTQLLKDPPNAFLDSQSSHLTLDYSEPDLADEATGVLWAIEHLEELHLRDRVHGVTVEGWGSLTNFTRLSLGLRDITRLEELHWSNNDPIPPLVLSAVEESHPGCKIFYNMVFSNWDRYDRTVSPIQAVGEEPHRDIRSKTRRLILGSKNLAGLSTHVEYGSQPDSESLPLVHEILTTCSNLKRLDLSISHGGCMVSWPQPYDFNFSGKSQLTTAPFPPLESLRLSSYDLDGPYSGRVYYTSSWDIDRSELKWPWHYVPKLVLQNIPGPWLYAMKKPYVRREWPGCPSTFNETTNLDGWLERMNFGRLQSLTLNRPSSTSLYKLRPALTNLLSLTIHGGDICSADMLGAFLANNTVPLQQLHLGNMPLSSLDCLLDVLASHHGEALTSLVIHEEQDFRQHSCRRWEDGLHPRCQNKSRDQTYDDHLYFNTSQLQRLQTSSPYIHLLDIDIDRDLDAAEQIPLFDALGSFQSLSALTLRLESPTFQARRNGTCQDHWPCYDLPLQDKLVNKTWVQNVFSHIRGAQVAHRVIEATDGSSSNSQSDEVDTNLIASPSLTSLVVIVGPWSTRNQVDMIGPEKNILGRFECSARTVREPSSAGMDNAGLEQTAEECEGWLQWPIYYGWEEDDYAFPQGIDEDYGIVHER